MTAPIAMTAFAHALPPIAVLLVLEAGQSISRQAMKKQLAEANATTLAREAILEQELAEARSAAAKAAASARELIRAAKADAERAMRAQGQKSSTKAAAVPANTTPLPAGNVTWMAVKRAGTTTQETRDRIVHLRRVERLTVSQVVAETGTSRATVNRVMKDAAATAAAADIKVA